MDTRGVFYWPAMGKWRVRLNRKRVTYKIGYFDTFEEAMKAKQDFLDSYELDEMKEFIVPKYSKEWYRQQQIEQAAKFAIDYGTGARDKPTIVIATSEWEYKQKNENWLKRTSKDSYEGTLFELN